MVRAIFYTSAFPNMVHADVLPKSAVAYLSTIKLPTVRDTSWRVLSLLGALLFYLHVGSVQLRIWVFVGTSLAALCILGTFFVDRYVRAI